MTSYFIDTNIFLRTMAGDHARQTKECDDFFMLLHFGEILAHTSSVVLAEVVWTGQSYYHINKKDIVESVCGIINAPYLTLDDRADMQGAFELYAQYTIKFVDALIASHPSIQSGSLSLVSYDKDFDKLGVKRIEPWQVVRLYGGK